METTKETINRQRPRCPYCHDDVHGDGQKQGCPSCMAWHHSACWQEAGERCSSCSAASAPVAVADPVRGSHRASSISSRLGSSAGVYEIPGVRSEVLDRLRVLLAAANCRVEREGSEVLNFHHGTFLTHSSPDCPKAGSFKVVGGCPRIWPSHRLDPVDRHHLLLGDFPSNHRLPSVGGSSTAVRREPPRRALGLHAATSTSACSFSP